MHPCHRQRRKDRQHAFLDDTEIATIVTCFFAQTMSLIAICKSIKLTPAIQSLHSQPTSPNSQRLDAVPVTVPDSRPAVSPHDGGIKRSAPPAFPPRRASEPPGPPTASFTHSHSNSQSARMPQVTGWMVGTASHTPGKPHSPHTIESVELPPHVLKFIERGFGMRVVRKDRRGSWDLSNADCLRLIARTRLTRLRRPQDEDRIQAAERGLQAVQLDTPPSVPRTLPSPTTGSPPPGVICATRVTRSMSKSKPYDRFIEA